MKTLSARTAWTVVIPLLDQKLTLDGHGPARAGFDLDENRRKHQAVLPRLKTLGEGGQEALQGLLPAHADDRPEAAGHARIGKVGRASGQDLLVG
ncbi:MAG: hypothetical protein MUP19_00645, partial [Candidatus Aminicenantes bacterium]|nr:hypothetical protein [Candidatus Aminicenantes bacterium]